MNTTINPDEVHKFTQHASQWWDTEGPLKTLHDINSTRLLFIQQQGALAGLRVLDLGCGGGILSEALAKEDAQVTGLDASAEAIECAKNHAQQSQLSINYLCSPVEAFQQDPFDVIVCMEMLEHVDEPHVILEHCKRLLKPGGLLFLSTLNRTLKAYAGAIVFAEYVLKLLPKQTHDYQKFIKPSELAAMGRHVGLELMKIEGMHYNPISRQANLTNNVQINYLMVLKNEEASSF